MVYGFRFNTKRYIAIFTELTSKMMPKRSKQSDPDDVLISIS
jgi:hypothetical protein